MAYGLEILTTEGVSSAENIISAQLVHSQRISGNTGSITVPNYDSTSGSMFVISKDDESRPYIPEFSFNNSTKVFEWSPYSYLGPRTSTKNVVFFFRIY